MEANAIAIQQANDRIAARAARVAQNSAPTTPAVVPVTAPTGQTSTTSSPATPTAVVSSAPAIKDMNNISGVVTDASNAISAQAQAQVDAKAAAATTAAATKASQTPATPLTPEQQLMGQPDSGNMFIYDRSTGEQSQVPKGSVVPPTSTTVDLKNAAAVNSIETPNATIKQFADGSYGMYDASGKYIGAATSKNFADAQGVEKAQSDLLAIQNGTYPLNPGQQAQVDSMTRYYNDLMEAQRTENANVTGNETGLQNLFGVGGTAIASSAINKTIQDGANKIAEINRKMVEAVSALQSALKTDNTNVITKLYSTYQNNIDAKQKELDTMHAELFSASEKRAQNQSTVNDFFAKKYPDVTEPILPTDTGAQMQAKLKTSPKYIQDTTVASGLSTEQNQFWADMATTGVSLSGILPNLGIGAAAAQAKLQIMKTISDNAKTLGLSAQDVANGILDKKSKAATIMKLQQKGSELSAQAKKVEDDFQMVKSAGAKIPASVYQSGIPVLQNWINSGGVNGGVLGDTASKELTAYLGLLTTSMTNYARVVAGQTGSAGTTANINNEIQSILSKGLSPSIVNYYIDNAAIPEMRNTTKGYDTTMKSLTNSMNQADGTVGASVTDGGLGISNSGNTSTTSANDPLGIR